ncbi:MAG: transglycosylase SLT domain-containing protein [Thiomicrospira sp.]
MTANFFTTTNSLRGYWSVLLITLILSLVSITVQANNAQEQHFLDAIDALKKGQRHAFNQHKQALQDHPLLIYALYQDYLRNIEHTPNAAIEQFIERYAHTAAAQRLHQHWLKHLAKQAQWQTLLDHAPRFSTDSLQCQIMQAQLQTQPNDVDIAQLQTLWLSLPTHDQACQSIEGFLVAQQQLTSTLVWQKITAAMHANALKQVRSLRSRLKTNEQHQLDTWLQLHQQPHKIAHFNPTNSSTLSAEMVIHILQRLAQRKPEEAAQQLTRLDSHYGFSDSQRLAVQRQIGLRLAYRYDDKAQAHLAQVNQQGADEDTLRWQAQIALRQSDWKTLLDTLSLMPFSERQQPKWQYWTARALAMTNQAAQAQPIYQQLAQARHYYGFLAADQLNLPYQLNGHSAEPAPNLNNLRQTYPAIALVEALFAVNWTVSANREWQHLIQTAAGEDLAGLAAIASEWQQHNIAIRTLAQGKLWDRIDLRFPTPYKEPVMQSAEKNKIQPSWIYGVMRRESAFSPDIRSPAGAVGLMQILPNTARYVGRKIGYSQHQYANLTDARSNIELGSAYLRYLLERYDGNLVLATAAYNAGPRRVDSWIMNDVIAADQWIDSIPFKETRKYVKSVLEYTMVFQNLLDNRYDRLTPLMLPIGQYSATKQLDLP